MLAVSETESYFLDMLASAGFDAGRPDPLLAWRVFRAFSDVPVECADDALLFQCGTYDFTGRDLFHFELVRQFTIEEDGEYDHMEQLHCAFYYEPDAELRGLETSLWSQDCGSPGEFFSRVETLPEFDAVRGRTPRGAEVFQEEV